MYKFFVGIDVSKYWIDAAWTRGSKPQYLGRYANHTDGYQQMVAQLRKCCDAPVRTWFICFENTGSYSKPLLHWLSSQQLPCREESALRILKEAGIRRGKSDKIDCQLIALYALKNRDQLKPTQLPHPGVELMKKLLSRRDFLVRQRASLLKSLKEQKAEFPPEVFSSLQLQSEQLISMYTEHIRWIEQQIETVLESHGTMGRSSQLLQSIKGIGPVIAWYLIAYSDNFQCFANARAFASYCGIAPFPHASGLHQGNTRVSHLANKHIKAILTNGVLAAIQSDRELKIYYQRKTAEGKPYGSVINALKNKLVARAFAVVKRGTPFVPMCNYA